MEQMREINIKTSVSQNHKRKNLSIIEMIDQNGLSARAEKKFSYYVTERAHSTDNGKLQEWMKANEIDYKKKDRHVSIRKFFDKKTGMGQMIYRVIGSFYLVRDLHVFAVVFMHSIKFDMLSRALPEANQA